MLQSSQTEGSLFSSWAVINRISLPTVALTPFRITVIYICLGLSALFASDVLIPRFLDDPFLSQIQAAKGGVEVFLTGVLILTLTSRRESQIKQEHRQLNEQRRELSILHRVLRHNIRNDINVISGRAEIVSKSVADPHVSDQCEKIFEKVTELVTYTEKASGIRKITESAGQYDSHDLAAILPQITDSHPLNTSGVNVSYDFTEKAIVSVNPFFPEALEEVITNAFTHNDAETPILSITVNHTNGKNGSVEIQVADNGPGIPVAEQKAIADGTEDPLDHSIGMGLWFVEWAVRHSKGEFELEENRWEGTTAIIRVPRAH